MSFSLEEVKQILFFKTKEIQEHVPEGLTNREYILLALECLDQGGAPLYIQKRVLQNLENLMVWEEDER